MLREMDFQSTSITQFSSSSAKSPRYSITKSQVCPLHQFAPDKSDFPPKAPMSTVKYIDASPKGAAELAVLAATLADKDKSTEGDVNGLWNRILNIYFPAIEGYAIKPELKMINKGFCDLIVFKEAVVNGVLERATVLVFEGKGPLSQNPRTAFDNVHVLDSRFICPCLIFSYL
jgi:hypothetical protein